MATDTPVLRICEATAVQTFHSIDIDESRAELRRVYYPMQLTSLDASNHYFLRMSTTHCGALTVGRIRYGSTVRHDVGELVSAYHVNVPLNGSLISTCGVQQVAATPVLGAVFNPDEYTTLNEWSAGAEVVALKIGREELEEELSSLLGHPVCRPIRFQMGMDLTSPLGRGWWSAMRILAAELDAPGGLAQHPILASELQRLVIGGLLWGQAHTYSDQLREPVRPTRPRAVKLVIDLIHATPEQPWSISELATHAGTSVRALQDGFHRHVGMPPLAYLRDCRLDRVHSELLRSSPNASTVAAVGFRWGFTHLGRLSSEYRRKYGVNPSETLRYGMPDDK